MAATKCTNCNRYLGEHLSGDVYCKCQFYNIIRTGEPTKLVHKTLYTKATVPMSQ